MDLNKLTLKDKKIFTGYLRRLRHELCVFSFENIYIWKALFDISWTIIQGRLCVFFKDKTGCFMYLPPLGGPANPEIISGVFAIMNKFNRNPQVSRIENLELKDVRIFTKLGLEVREKYPDYLCLRLDLVKLQGNKFKSQRSSFNYFTKHYNFSSEPFSVKHIAGCNKIFASWIKQRAGKNQDPVYLGMLEDSRKVLKAIFTDYQDLDYTGIVVKVDNQAKGFSLGYKLNQDTFCIIYEVTDLSIKGLAQFIFQAFARQLTGFKYINIMDDSGLENLRKTKLSYHPARLIPGYIATGKYAY